MNPPIDRLFTDCSSRQLEQLASRIHDCLGRLTHDQIWARGGENENAPGNLVLHLCGNVRQWILSGIGGQADFRRRDAEFAARAGAPATELSAQLAAVVAEAVAVIDRLDAARLAETVEIQKYNVTVLEAVYHVVEHFAQHTGQIIFVVKQITGGDLGYYAHLNAPAHDKNTP